MARRSSTTAATAAVLAALLAAAAPASAAAPAAPRSFTLAAAGDVTIQQSLWEMADSLAPGRRVYDFTPLFAPIEPWISSADLAICHLETSLSPDSSRLGTQPRFSAPRELAEGLASAGYDLCSTAANHALDWGLRGLMDTLDVLDAAGIGHAGTARSPEEDHPALFDAGGAVVGFVSATIGTNGHYISQKWAVNYLRVDEVLADAAWAREHGAEFVIVGLHWGAEYTTAPAGYQREIAGRLTASPDVDLIVGHHTHMVQPVELINGKYVVYGLGNHFSNIRTEPDGSKRGGEDGIIVHFQVTEQVGGAFAVTGAWITPTWAHPVTKQILPVDHTLAYGPEGLAGELRRSLALTLDRAGASGVHLQRTPTPWPPLTCRGRVATVLGTPGGDLLVGTGGADVVVARGGDDSVWAGGGDDLVCLGDGDDFANAGAGDDTVWAGGGGDLVLGGDGADVLWGGGEDDLLSGQEGADLVVGGTGDDALLGGNGDDLLWGGDGDDLLWGGDGDDGCRGAAAEDSCEA